MLAIWVAKNFVEAAVGNRFLLLGKKEIVNDALYLLRFHAFNTWSIFKLLIKSFLKKD